MDGLQARDTLIPKAEDKVASENLMATLKISDSKKKIEKGQRRIWEPANGVT
jgi:hypothetical protein